MANNEPKKLPNEPNSEKINNNEVKFEQLDFEYSNFEDFQNTLVLSRDTDWRSHEKSISFIAIAGEGYIQFSSRKDEVKEVKKNQNESKEIKKGTLVIIPPNLKYKLLKSPQKKLFLLVDEQFLGSKKIENDDSNRWINKFKKSFKRRLSSKLSFLKNERLISTRDYNFTFLPTLIKKEQENHFSARTMLYQEVPKYMVHLSKLGHIH